MSNSSVPVGDTGDFLQTYLNTVSGALVHSEAVTPTDPAGVPFSADNPFPVTRDAFTTLIRGEAVVGQELRREETSTDDYHGRAADGAATNTAVWEIVRFYKDGSGNVTRWRYRSGVKWDERASGWT